ncbi:hypothetical protein N8500_09950 [Candidatus Puniceispirillum sp.]|nr:hypothetical protein [Candidatus Puniceispirillum sp.]
MAIGRAFYVGEGVEEDNQEAIKWLEVGARSENHEAQFLLGECYLKGFGVAIDIPRAGVLLRSSSAQGNCDAMQMLSEHAADLDETDMEKNAKKDDGNVFDLGKSLTFGARRLYSKKFQSEGVTGDSRAYENVIKLHRPARAS